MTPRHSHLRQLPRLLALILAIVAGPFAMAQSAPSNTAQQLVFAGLNTAAHRGRADAVQADKAGNVFLLLDEGDGLRLEKTDSNGNAALAQIHLGAAGDSGTAMALDPSGNVYVAGSTSSSLLPGTSGAAIPSRTDTSTNSFVAKFDTNLNLLFLTFTGGSRIAAAAIAASGDSVFVTGILYGSNLPVTASGIQQTPASGTTQNGFVERFSNDGTTLIYATYLTGSGGSTTPTAIAVDASDDAWIAGQTSASGFPTVAALVPAMLGNPSGFVLRLTPAGDGITASTFIPGSGLTSLALDSTGQVLLASGAVALGQFPVDTVTSPPIPTTYQTLLRLSLDLSSVLSGTLIAPGTLSSVAPAANGGAWVDGTLTAPLLPLTPLSTIGIGFAAEVTNTGSPYPYQVTQTARLGGVAVTNLSYASLPLTLSALAVNPAGEALFAGTLQPTASASLLATETYDLPLRSSPTSALPASVRSSETTAATCSGSLCSGSAAYLAKLAPSAAAAPAFSVDDAPFVTLRNLGSISANGVALTVSTGSFTTSCSQTLAPGAECAVLLASGAGGASGASGASGTISVSYTDAATSSSATQSAFFPAFTPAAQTIDFLPKELDFGIVTGAGAGLATRTITVANLGSTTQSFTSTADLPQKATTQYSEAASDCPMSGSAQTKLLAAGAVCHITLAFTAFTSATKDGAVAGQWTIGTRDVALLAQSQAAALSLSAPQIDFGTQYSGGLRLPRYLYISNSFIESVPHTVLAAASGPNFTLTDHCPTSLPPSSVCQIRVDYKAASAPSTDTVTLHLDAGLSVLVTGKTLPQPGVTGSTVNPSLSVTPAAITFPSPVVVTSVSSSSQTVTVMNSGASAFSLNLALNGDFADVTSCGTSLAAGATCAVEISFAPSQPGTRNGLLAITAGSGFAPFYVPLSGTATAILPGTNSTIDFGSTVVGEPVTQYLKLAQPFSVLSVQATGPYTVALIEDGGFGVGNPPPVSFSTSVSRSCRNCFLAIRLSPVTTGVQTGVLTLSSAAAGMAYQLALAGIATPASGLLLTPAAFNFGNVPVHSSSEPVLFTVTNQLIPATSVTVSGTSATRDFVISVAATGAPACVGQLAAGASCGIAVQFAPGAEGARAGTLTVTSSSGNVTSAINGQAVADPGIALNPSRLNFTNTPDGSAARQTVTVTNTSSYPTTIGPISVSVSSFQASTTCATLSPQATCSIAVAYTPGQAIASGTLTIPATTNNQPTNFTVPLAGSYTASAAGIEVFPGQANFGPVATGVPGPTLLYTISNFTGKTFSITTSFPRNYLPAGPPCSTLAANGMCSFEVTFIPLVQGDLPGSIVIGAVPSDGSATLTAIAYGEGYGQGQENLSLGGALISENVFNFGQVASGQTGIQTFTVGNTGGIGSPPITIRRVTSLPPFLSTTTCGAALAPGQICTVTVHYTPSNLVAAGSSSPAATPDTGLLTIESDAANSPQQLNLTGQGGPVSSNNPQNSSSLSSFTLAEGALSFPQVTAGNASATQVVTFTNAGNVTLHIASVTAPADFTAATTCGTVMPLATCSISVASTPQTSGTKTGAIKILSDSSTSLDYISLFTVAAASPLIIDPGTLNFGSVQVGQSSTLAVQVTNSSSAPISFTSITATTAYQAGGTCRTLAASATPLAANASCTVQVLFSPTAAGQVAGTLAIRSSASTFPLTVALSGLGLQSSLTVGPSALAFGSIVLGSPANLSVTLTNGGTAPVSGLVLSATGDYAVTIPCLSATLAPGASCVAQVTFTPSAAGPRGGSLTILSSGPSSPLTVPLSGTGIAGGSFVLLVNGAGSASVSVVSGHPAAYTLSVTQVGNFNGNVALTCTAITAGQYVACSLNPASLALISSPLYAAATINTITSATNGAQVSGGPLESLARVLLCLLFPGLLSIWRSRRTLYQRLPVIAALWLTTLTLMVMGCGGKGGGGGDPNVRYTPAGTYQYQVTAASTSGPAVSQTVILNLTVTPR